MAEQENGSAGARITDARTLRALAHPARIEIVDHLATTGASVTATECAELVGLSPSATSYHLRELAKYGLVEQAPNRGDGRERLWRSVNASLWLDGDVDTPESLAANRAVVDVYLERDQNRIRDFMDRQAEEPPEWREAAGLMGQQLLLTAAELAELNSKVRALMEPYRLRERQVDAPPSAREVSVQYRTFPMP
jgi:DNA-binding transcriptional ArsR family regulator